MVRWNRRITTLEKENVIQAHVSRDEITENTNPSRIVFRGTQYEYFDILSRIQAQQVQFSDLYSLCPEVLRLFRYVAIRHDIDIDLEKAVGFAWEEAKAGVQSTYFLLHTAPYFDYSKKLINQCRKIVSFGHDIGFHNNAISEWLTLGKSVPIDRLIRHPLQFLRDSGIRIIGTSAHGDPVCKAHNAINYEIWTECPHKLTKKHMSALQFPRYSLSEFGLEYETYFLPKDAYLSDAGGRWNDEDPYKLIEKFNRRPFGVMQFLVHPVWWRIQ